MTMNILLASLLAISVFSGSAQEKSKKVITSDDYAQWKTIGNESVSHDGQTLVYELNPQQGDGYLMLRSLKNGSDVAFHRGYKAELETSGNFLAFHIKPPEDSVRIAKKNKVKKEDMPLDSLGIFRLGHSIQIRFGSVKSYDLPEVKSEWIAFLTKTVAPVDTTADKKKSKDKPSGDTMVLLHVPTGDTLMFQRVTSYRFAKKAGKLFFSQEGKDSTATRSVISVWDSPSRRTSVLFSEEGWVKDPVPNEIGSQVAFLHSSDTAKVKVYSLVLADAESSTSQVVASENLTGMPVGWSPSEHGRISFSEDGKKLYFGTALTPQPEPVDSLLPEEKPSLDIWHWQDATLQPQQKAELDREKKRTFQAVYHTDTKRLIQLADLKIRDVSTIQKGNGNVALGSDVSNYQRASSWTGSRYRDAYLIDLATGIKRLMLQEKNIVQLSPGGKYIVWYEQADSAWYARSTDLTSTEEIPLTKMIPVKFYNETDDTPAPPSPYGIAGWAPDDRYIYIYDRFDIWRIDPSGDRVPVSMTQSYGRRNNLRLRYVKTDPEEEHIPSKPGLLLSAFQIESMQSGFFSADFSTVKEPVKLLLDDHFYSFSAKAKESDLLVWKKEDAVIFPDLWVSDSRFNHAKQVSDANPQQSEYNWATTELVEWNSFTGERLKGILYKPENFNPEKKYPMVIYFYETMSESVNRHQIPSPSRSTINRTMYASNGYLVFVPDITYKTGYPGEGAYNAVVSGAHHLISAKSFVDKDRIGIQGQSWGGYQVAYLITRTDMFAAGMAGAPVSNMTSAYGGIRWETGMSRMFQYEQTQSRIGGTLWEKPMHYIDNSPLFYAPKINTPLLMMHNDNDGAVPWYQGIEMFVALRRLDKPVWMLTYNNEPHNLKGESWANRMDLDDRMFQFFNHYLKGESMPEWMKDGLPAIEKGKKRGY